jgi:rhodanese-related sulfurtransferase
MKGQPKQERRTIVTDLQAISPERAAELLRKGAVLIDIREADEHARERIPGARHHALSRLDAESPARAGDEVLVFHCRSGARTRGNAARLSAAANCDAYILDGGLDAWKKAGLPVTLDRSQPIDIIRQVQIAAGSLVLMGMLLGTFFSPGFYAISAFVGAGLVFAGVSGFCGMAHLLALMPWNRRTARTA